MYQSRNTANDRDNCSFERFSDRLPGLLTSEMTSQSIDVQAANGEKTDQQQDVSNRQLLYHINAMRNSFSAELRTHK